MPRLVERCGKRDVGLAETYRDEFVG